MTEKGIPARNPTMMKGSVAGKKTSRTTCQPEAPMMRMMATYSSFTDRSPAKVLMNTTKNTMVKMIAIFDIRPMPNHMTNTGASATFGMPLNSVM